MFTRKKAELKRTRILFVEMKSTLNITQPVCSSDYKNTVIPILIEEYIPVRKVFQKYNCRYSPLAFGKLKQPNNYYN